MKTYAVGNRMIRHPFTTEPEEGIAQALQMMRDNDIRHLPVVENDRLVGIVSERDLKAAGSLDRASLLTVGDVMRDDLFVVNRNSSIGEVASEMADGKIGSAIVVDQDGHIEGIFTTTDALRLLSDLIEDRTIDEFMFAIHEDFEDGLRTANW